MNKLKFAAYLVAGAMLFSACGGSDEEEYEEEKGPDNILEAFSNLKEAGEKMEEKLKESEEKMEKRRESGDTLAMHYEELMKYLPEEIDGYTREEPTGGSVNYMNVSYSNAEAKYTKDNGDYIKVSLVDYNMAYGLYQGATAMWATGMSIDNTEEKANGIKLGDDIAGWEVYRKKAHNATLTLGLGARFLLGVEANNQDGTEFVKDVAKSMQLNDLAAM